MTAIFKGLDFMITTDNLLKPPSQSGFIDFIFLQEKSREINHKHWDLDCVADYMADCGEMYDDILEFIGHRLSGLDWPLRDFNYTSSDGTVIRVEALYQLLDEAKPIELSGVKLSTYGNLCDVLENHLLEEVSVEETTLESARA